MYKSFYNLNRDPFASGFESVFLWLGEKHKEALSVLRYGILDNKGFLLLSGLAGTGKTTLISALTKSFGADVEWAIISDPKLERIDFYNAIANSFGLEKQFSSKVQFLIQFSHFLHKADDEKKKVVLIIDECHLLSQEMLEELRLLSNIEKADTKLINIFFVGQPEFKNMLVQPENRAVRQRLTLKNELNVLNANEIDEYIRHRLKVAGSEEKIFSNKAVHQIEKSTQGVAKNIDVLCRNLLIVGAAKGQRKLDQKDVVACLQHLKLPAHPTNEDFENVEDVIYSQVPSEVGDATASVDDMVELSGFPVEQKSRRTILPYVLGTLLISAVGGYVWFGQQKPQEASQEIAKVEKTVIEQKVVEKELPSVGSSPSVAVLEKDSNEINEQKAAELKSTILKKAYNDSDNEEEKQVDTLEVKEDAILGVSSSPAVTVFEKNSSEINKEKAAEIKSKILEKAYSDSDREAEKPVNTLAEKEDVISVDSSSPPTEEYIVPTATTTDGEISDTLEAKEVEEVFEVEDAPDLPPLEPILVRLPLLPNSLKLTRTGMKRLTNFVDKLKNYPRATILVKGFVSSKSNSPENIKLSEARANSVQKMLLNKGVDPEQVEVVGLGNKEPIASNDTREGRTKNRRVEIMVITDGT